MVVLVLGRILSSLGELPSELNQRLLVSDTCLGCEFGHPGMECVGVGVKLLQNSISNKYFSVLAKTII